jgi:hypothetical protein
MGEIFARTDKEEQGQYEEHQTTQEGPLVEKFRFQFKEDR